MNKYFKSYGYNVYKKDKKVRAKVLKYWFGIKEINDCEDVEEN